MDKIRIALNDLSFRPEAHSAENEKRAIHDFYRVVSELLGRSYHKVEQIRGNYPRYSSDLCFNKGLNKYLQHDETALLLSFLNRLVPCEYTEHSFRMNGFSASSHICSWAKNGYLISIAFLEAFSNDTIAGICDSNGNRQLSIKNISSPAHLEKYAAPLGKRKYVRSEKHRAHQYFRNGDLVSEMDLSDQDAQKLLDHAVSINSDSTRLYNIERASGRCYAFPLTVKNIYHGFLYEPQDRGTMKKILAALGR